MGKNDLDIFGEQTPNIQEDEGNTEPLVEVSVQTPEMDLFGDMDTNEQTGSEEAPLTEEEGMDEEAQEANEEAEIASTEALDAEAESEGIDEELAGEEVSGDAEVPLSDAEVDAEIARLLAQLESESSSENPDEDIMGDLVDDLRIKISDLESEKQFLEKQYGNLQTKLLEYADKDTEMSFAKPIIDKVNGSSDLKALIKVFGSEEGAGKDRYVNILAKLYNEATGIDIDDIMSEREQAKMNVFAGKRTESSPEIGKKEEEKPLTREESLTMLF